jgi:hypothetical protein
MREAEGAKEAEKLRRPAATSGRWICPDLEERSRGEGALEVVAIVGAATPTPPPQLKRKSRPWERELVASARARGGDGGDREGHWRSRRRNRHGGTPAQIGIGRRTSEGSQGG